MESVIKVIDQADLDVPEPGINVNENERESKK